ncbi:hypothetical protein HPHPH36_1149 [Helicobacter pylori Hp H-36]|nr:hypothetical protein HPHPH36_1149 [Helicobacter pylori Hp H-36]
MAFFNIFKMNFLKPYYRTFSPNKGINFTPTIQLKRIFLKRVGIERIGHSNPVKSLL